MSARPWLRASTSAAVLADDAAGQPVLCPVVRQDRLGEGLFELWLQAPHLTRAAAGQFVHVRCDTALLRRPFSLYRVAWDRVSILYQVKGKGTRWLSSLQTGDSLDVLGPLGRAYTAPGTGERLLLVGGGVGVAPIAMYAGQYGHRAALRAIVGFRSQAQVVGLAPFTAIGMPVTVHTDDGSAGLPGRVTVGLAKAIRDHAADRVLVCGPDLMMRAVAEIAQMAGVACDVSVERPMGCGIGVCLACVVPVQTPEGTSSYRRACCEGPVFNAAEVIW